MKIKKKKLLEAMKDWTKKTMVEEDEKLNKVRIAKKKQKNRKDAKDVVHKALYKIYYKTSIIIYNIDMYRHCFFFFFFFEETIIFIRKHKHENCKDQIWLGSRIGMDLSPNDPNNEFIEYGRES